MSTAWVWDSAGNVIQIIDRDKNNWKVTLYYYNAINQVVKMGEGEGWDYQDAYNLAMQDISL